MNSPYQTGRRAWHGPLDWDGRITAQSSDWLTELSESDITRLHQAVESTRASDIPIAELKSEDFPLGELADRLSSLRERILNGCGYAVLRGLPADRWTDEELIRAYWGIGTLYRRSRIPERRRPSARPRNRSAPHRIRQHPNLPDQPRPTLSLGLMRYRGSIVLAPGKIRRRQCDCQRCRDP